jgi:FtsH-binding integral membrane protein
MIQFADEACIAAEALPEQRATFIRRAYNHLALAIVAFVGLEVALFQSGLAAKMAPVMMASRMSWLVVLGGFAIVSWMADRWARSEASAGMQYFGLALYVVAEAVTFVPLLYLAQNYASPRVIPLAAMLTGVLFLGLSFFTLVTGADFSFFRGFLCIGGVIALGLVGASLVFGFDLGLAFSAAMVMLAAVAILYTTSNILHEYNTDQHVAAALALFAAIALLFWYMIRIVMRFAR